MEFTSRLTHFSPSSSTSSGFPLPRLCPGTSNGTTLLFFNCSSASYTGACICGFSSLITVSSHFFYTQRRDVFVFSPSPLQKGQATHHLSLYHPIFTVLFLYSYFTFCKNNFQSYTLARASKYLLLLLFIDRFTSDILNTKYR